MRFAEIALDSSALLPKMIGMSKTLTSNQHYKGLNNRFDRRAARLRQLGFAYRSLVPGIACFTRMRMAREQNILAATAMHADQRTWHDQLRLVLK